MTSWVCVIPSIWELDARNDAVYVDGKNPDSISAFPSRISVSLWSRVQLLSIYTICSLRYNMWRADEGRRGFRIQGLEMCWTALSATGVDWQVAKEVVNYGIVVGGRVAKEHEQHVPDLIKYL